MDDLGAFRAKASSKCCIGACDSHGEIGAVKDAAPDCLIDEERRGGHERVFMQHMAIPVLDMDPARLCLARNPATQPGHREEARVGDNQIEAFALERAQEFAASCVTFCDRVHAAKKITRRKTDDAKTVRNFFLCRSFAVEGEHGHVMRFCEASGKLSSVPADSVLAREEVIRADQDAHRAF